MHVFEQPTTAFACEIKYGKIRNFYVGEIALGDTNVSCCNMPVLESATYL